MSIEVECVDDVALKQLDEICKTVEDLRANNSRLKSRVTELEKQIASSCDFVLQDLQDKKR